MGSTKEQINYYSSKEDISLPDVLLVYSGEDYFLRLQKIIANAQSEIHVQTYIFINDTIGIKIANALKEAASRNVTVYVLVDGFGSASLTPQFINDLISHGIHFRVFSPFFSTNSLYLGRRLHHKIVVADGNIALIGGINISDNYRGSEIETPWLDYAVQTGNVALAEYLQQVCRNIYFKKKNSQREKIKSTAHSSDGTVVSILQNDWLKKKNEISKAYANSIRNAKQEIIIVGSYFLPSRKLTTILKRASNKGVTVKLILSGISDIPLMRRATSYLYSSLLKHNIELYEWNKSVLHGKVSVVDRAWTTVGSFNLNHLSSYGSIEMNVGIHSSGFSEMLASHLTLIITQCEKITTATLKIRRGIFTNSINWLAYRVIRIALIMVTYIPFKRFFLRGRKSVVSTFD